MMLTSLKADKAAKLIRCDIESRKVIGNEWDGIDDELKSEIEAQWAKIIEACFD
jgi:hypothetical protein